MTPLSQTLVRKPAVHLQRVLYRSSWAPRIHFLKADQGLPPGPATSLATDAAAAPLANWTTNLTGVFDVSGAFSNAIPINTSEPARFFRMKTP